MKNGVVTKVPARRASSICPTAYRFSQLKQGVVTKVPFQRAFYITVKFPAI